VVFSDLVQAAGHHGAAVGPARTRPETGGVPSHAGPSDPDTMKTHLASTRRRFLRQAGALPLALPAIGLLAASTRAAERHGAAGFDPVERSFADLQQAMGRGETTAAALVAAYLERIARFDQAGPEHRSVLAVNPAALEAARALDRERKAGKLRGPLHGIPLLIKDNIETQDPLPTTAGSLALARSFRAADAPLVARLRAAGAIVLGKTNLSEWANFRGNHSSSGWSAVGGQTRNAYDRLRNPSGSSAGSGVGAAASFCAAAIGTETDGSILSPASVNGIVGLKPTVGAVSGKGIVPITPRQDTAGPMARTVADAAALFAAMREPGRGVVPDMARLEAARLRGLRIGVLAPASSSHPGAAAVHATVRAALAHEGAVLVDAEAPAGFAAFGDAEYEAMLFEFKAALEAYLAGLDPARVPTRTLAALIDFNRAQASRELPFFGQEIFEAAANKGPLDDPAYLSALKTIGRGAETEGLAALFASTRAGLLMALSNGPAELIDPVWGDRPDGGWPVLASAAAAAGYPGITLPAGTIRGLPIGVTLVGPRFAEGALLEAAFALERVLQARKAPVVG
jgi:amidase